MTRLLNSLRMILLLLAIFSFVVAMSSFAQGDVYPALRNAFFATWCQLMYLITNKISEGQ